MTALPDHRARSLLPSIAVGIVYRIFLCGIRSLRRIVASLAGCKVPADVLTTHFIPSDMREYSILEQAYRRDRDNKISPNGQTAVPAAINNLSWVAYRRADDGADYRTVSD